MGERGRDGALPKTQAPGPQEGAARTGASPWGGRVCAPSHFLTPGTCTRQEPPICRALKNNGAYVPGDPGGCREHRSAHRLTCPGASAKTAIWKVPATVCEGKPFANFKKSAREVGDYWDFLLDGATGRCQVCIFPLLVIIGRRGQFLQSASSC